MHDGRQKRGVGDELNTHRDDSDKIKGTLRKDKERGTIKAASQI